MEMEETVSLLCPGRVAASRVIRVIWGREATKETREKEETADQKDPREKW
jgi:hypothetical protein